MCALQNLELPKLRVAQCELVEQVVKLLVIIQNLISLFDPVVCQSQFECHLQLTALKKF